MSKSVFTGRFALQNLFMPERRNFWHLVSPVPEWQKNQWFRNLSGTAIRPCGLAFSGPVLHRNNGCWIVSSGISFLYVNAQWCPLHYCILKKLLCPMCGSHLQFSTGGEVMFTICTGDTVPKSQASFTTGCWGGGGVTDPLQMTMLFSHSSFFFCPVKGYFQVWKTAQLGRNYHGSWWPFKNSSTA